MDLRGSKSRSRSVRNQVEGIGEESWGLWDVLFKRLWKSLSIEAVEEEVVGHFKDQIHRCSGVKKRFREESNRKTGMIFHLNQIRGTRGTRYLINDREWVDYFSHGGGREKVKMIAEMDPAGEKESTGCFRIAKPPLKPSFSLPMFSSPSYTRNGTITTTTHHFPKRKILLVLLLERQEEIRHIY